MEAAVIFMAGISVFLLFLLGLHKENAVWDDTFLLGLFFLSAVFFWGNTGAGMWHIRRLCRQIDQGEDILAEIVGESKRESTSEQWKQWENRLSLRSGAGSVGRLYERIWEAAQIFRDRETQQKREQAYLRDLMHDISHQMKTPLAALQVFMDIFAKELQDREKLSAMTVQAQDQIERMRWLVTGMLKLAQVESGALRWEKKCHPVWPVLQKSMDALQVLIGQKELEIDWEADAKVEGIFDADWMQEAFVNILKNACEYSPQSGKIRIQVGRIATVAMISVTDYGPGIRQEEIPKIFNRFYRVKGGSRDGVGIGLALAKSIIEAQGGIITVYSRTGKESYTQFVVILGSTV